jgi:putative pyruvate formate lyase activating enzyme
MAAGAQPTERSQFQAAYLRLHAAGELQARVEKALAMLDDCSLCPRHCHVDRLDDKTSVCKTGRYAVVSSFFAHFGEEDCLRGWRGSGTIFFSWCHLRCVFCQNYDLSWLGQGRATRPEELAEMMLCLQEEGCHNINLVTPSHVAPQILEALAIAAGRGLKLPLVYNTGGYESLEALKLLDGVVDIYMPDFKFWDPEVAWRYSHARNYPEVARAAIKEMHRQVGSLIFDEHGLALHGLLLRHLVLPDGAAGTTHILRWIAETLGSETYINLMAQYRPAGRVNRRDYGEIGRSITFKEFQQATAIAKAVGLKRLDSRFGHEPRLDFSA